VIAPADIASGIQSAWSNYLARGARNQEPHDYVYASAWRLCDRRMVYDMTSADRLPAYDPELLAKFRRGDDRERDLLADLARIGRDAEPPFNVIGQQERFRLRDRRGRVAIVGKVDARLEIDGTRAPIEVKSWSPLVTDRLDTFADVFDNPWTRSGGYQLLSYLFGAAEPFGFLLLDRSGIPRLLPVELDRHLDRMDEFLTKAEHAIDHATAGTLPDFLDDATECRRCPWYGHLCNPPLSAAAPTILADPELEAALTRRADLKPAADEYASLDQDVKTRLRGVEHGIVGAFLVTGKWAKTSRVELPPDLKKTYTVTNPRGQFRLDITRL
jgi:hypothetical protein